jgi:hypothetical protein
VKLSQDKIITQQMMHAHIFTFAAFQFEGEAYLPNRGDRQFLSHKLLHLLRSNIHDIHPILMGHKSKQLTGVQL